jgi:CDP-diacylglycerol---glycerol-3-phosphate 3-phosphatidyltransferase
MLATVRSNVQRSCLRRATFGRLSTIAYRRTVSTSQLDPCLQSFASALAEKQPCFSVPSRDVDILSEPQQFYVALLVSLHRRFHNG